LARAVALRWARYARDFTDLARLSDEEAGLLDDGGVQYALQQMSRASNVGWREWFVERGDDEGDGAGIDGAGGGDDDGDADTGMEVDEARAGDEADDERRADDRAAGTATKGGVQARPAATRRVSFNMVPEVREYVVGGAEQHDEAGGPSSDDGSSSEGGSDGDGDGARVSSRGDKGVVGGGIGKKKSTRGNRAGRRDRAHRAARRGEED
jgi:hypothetical protein